MLRLSKKDNTNIGKIKRHSLRVCCKAFGDMFRSSCCCIFHLVIRKISNVAYVLRPIVFIGVQLHTQKVCMLASIPVTM